MIALSFLLRCSDCLRLLQCLRCISLRVITMLQFYPCRLRPGFYGCSWISPLDKRGAASVCVASVIAPAASAGSFRSGKCRQWLGIFIAYLLERGGDSSRLGENVTLSGRLMTSARPAELLPCRYTHLTRSKSELAFVQRGESILLHPSFRPAKYRGFLSPSSIQSIHHRRSTRGFFAGCCHRINYCATSD